MQRVLKLSYWRQNARWLGTGFGIFFLSSFGQTYFVSLSFGDLQSAFGLSHGQLGLLNTVVTLIGGVVIMTQGHWVDKVSVQVLIGISLPLMAISCFLFQSLWNLPFFVFALFILRASQGFLTLLAFTLVGRWFSATRGIAISVTAMGQNLGQMVLPITYVTIAQFIGWHWTWIGLGFCLLIASPFFFQLAARERHISTETQIALSPVADKTCKEVLRNPSFYAFILAILPMALVANTIFFHQVHLIQIRGWNLAQFTAGYSLMATCTIIFGFVSGSLVDRYSAIAYLPIYLLPLALGCLILGYVEDQWASLVFMVLMGISNAFSLTLYGAVWPEAFGTKHLGAIRSIVTMIVIFAAALGPGVAGVMLDAGVRVGNLIIGLGVLCMGISIAVVPSVRFELNELKRRRLAV